MRQVFYITVILLCAAAFRLYGVNWDQNQHLHPDERFLTMVAGAAKVPTSFSDYLDPKKSTLNPYNLDFGFYVYGTLPVTLNKIAVQGSDYDTYNGITISGRYLSAFLDIGTLLLVMVLGQMFVKAHGFDKRLPYLAGFLYAISVLPIQNAHFFTVDSFVTFFATLALVLAFRARFGLVVFFLALSGISFGFALASKVSAIYVLPLIIGVMLATIISQLREKPSVMTQQRVLEWFLGASLFIACTYLALRIGDPRMFASGNVTDIALNPQFKQNIDQLKSFSEPSIGFPPSVQWLSKKSIIFPLQNIAVFGLGIVYFICSMIGLIKMGLSKRLEVIVIVAWMVGFFLYQGTRFVTTMRYFYPMYPYLAIAGALGVMTLVAKTKKQYRKIVFSAIMIGILIWPLSFMAIYTRPHSRVAASAWILDNVPAKSRIATEYWDDWLPLTLPDKPILEYQGISIPVFDGDTPEKWANLEANFEKAEYYFLTSNRGYASIMPIPDYYPRMSAYYEKLFADDTEFEKIAEFTSYPTLNLGFMEIPFDDQWSEEAFTVYDHPKITIFKKRAK